MTIAFLDSTPNIKSLEIVDSKGVRLDQLTYLEKKDWPVSQLVAPTTSYNVDF